MRDKDTSWQKVAKWYSKSMSTKGQYFHEKIIIPNTLSLLNIKNGQNVLDLGCGEGILSRYLPKNAYYTGVDKAAELINFAKNKNRNPNCSFIFGDITKPLDISQRKYDVCTIILALQNVSDFNSVFKNVAKYLKPNGTLLVVLNHPCFRSPKLTGWGIDEGNKKQYRKIYQYMTSASIPIDMTPGGGRRTLTYTFHASLSDYSESLFQNGFSIQKIEEWVSDKTSVGKNSKMENIARDEIPMFMAVLARNPLTRQ